jgi:hypothetical protein
VTVSQSSLVVGIVVSCLQFHSASLSLTEARGWLQHSMVSHGFVWCLASVWSTCHALPCHAPQRILAPTIAQTDGPPLSGGRVGGKGRLEGIDQWRSGLSCEG